MADALPILLVVDDTPANIHLLSGILKGRFKVKAATSGEKALQIARKAPRPDMILLDVMMPEMDGYEVCRRLKEDPQTSGIPVIFVSGNVDDTERDTGLELGAADYVCKPVDPEGLLASIEIHLKRSTHSPRRHGIKDHCESAEETIPSALAPYFPYTSPRL